MNNYSLSGLNVPAEEFLRPFFALNEKICLRVFSDKPDTAFSGHKLECTLEGYSDVAENLRLHNEQNRGVYFVINYGGHEDADISRINAHFMEMDDLPLEEQLTKIQSFPLEPSLVVKTRKSLHCYWLMTNADKEKFRYIQKRLIAHFGADPACRNESRVFRLPGFLHCKEEPIMVECIKFNPELRYTQEQLEAVLPDIPNEPAPATSHASTANRGTQKGLVLAGKQCAFFQHCKKNAKTLSEPDWYAMITNLAVFEGGEDAIHKLSALYPKYNFEQTQAKIEHFYKSGTKPMTCQRIAEKGFKCSRIKNCKCKSPAGLAYFPLDIKDIRKLLSAYKISGNPVNDVFTVRQFLNDYMYNIDTGLAVTFINSEVKAKFNLKASDLKQLISYHAEVSRAFFSAQKSKRDTTGTELPSWYETTDRGSLRFMPGMLAKHLSEKFHAFYCTEQYYFYGNGVYSPQNDKDAKATVQKHLQPRHMLLAQINDAEGQWQLLIRKPVNEINPNPFIINVQNGLYNVLDGSLKEHDVSYYSTVQMKANYDPEAKCPRFLDFLHSTMEEPEIHLLQEIYGYFFVPMKHKIRIKKKPVHLNKLTIYGNRLFFKG